MDPQEHSRRRLLGYGCLLFGTPSNVLLFGQAPFTTQNIQEEIRRRLELGEALALKGELFRFYQSRNFAPAWTSPADIQALLNRLARASEEGLSADDYRVQELRSLAAARDPERAARAAADSDVRLTLAYMRYSRDLRGGRVSPETLDRLWTPTHRPSDLAVELSEALRRKAVDGSLRRAVPAQPAYRLLKEALARLRRLAGNVASVDLSPGAIEDQTLEQVRALRERLTLLGDLYPDQPVGVAELGVALYRFQRRHGVRQTSELDEATTRALNIPLGERIRTIELNLERWRWLPDDLGARCILVNIAAFEAQVLESGRRVLRIPAIVGRPYRRTPVFSGLMTHLVFSPYWNIPDNIAVRDKLPLIQEEPDYLVDQGLRIFPKTGSNSAEIEPGTIEWGALSATDFPYRLRQDPGPLNALGGVKFMFPNKYNVYLHDTPQPELFGESVRTFSAGCIRLQQPFALAVYLLQGRSEWTDENIRAAMNADGETTVVLLEPLPVHVVYLTAWVEEDGELNFRDDVYGRDALLADALLQRHEGATGPPRVP